MRDSDRDYLRLVDALHRARVKLHSRRARLVVRVLLLIVEIILRGRDE